MNILRWFKNRQVVEKNDVPKIYKIGDDARSPTASFQFDMSDEYPHCWIAENGKITWAGTRSEFVALLRNAARSVY